MSPGRWSVRTCSLVLGCVVRVRVGSPCGRTQPPRHLYCGKCVRDRSAVADRRCDTMFVVVVEECCVGVLGGVCDALFTVSGY